MTRVGVIGHIHADVLCENYVAAGEEFSFAELLLPGEISF